MYGSDTDEEEMYTSGQESEHRRSKGDSVLGGSRSRQGSYSDSVFRNKGDSVLGDDSPGSRSRNSDQEDRLQGELDRQERGSSREFDDSSEQKSPVASDTKVRVEVEVEVEAEVEAEASNEVVNSVTGNDEAEASNEVVNSVPGNDDVETVVETATPVFVVPRKPTPPVSVENVEPPPPARDRYG